MQNCNKLKEAIGVVKWVESNHLVSDGFKLELVKLMQDAQTTDPELGLDFDPIFNAQDYPEQGFVVDDFDSLSTVLSVKGKDQPAFKVTMRLVPKAKSWVVDGCGAVNMSSINK